MQPKTLQEALERIEELELLLKGPELPRWGMTKTEWTLFQLLLRREYMSNDGLYVALYGGNADRDPEITKVFVCKVRKKLAPLGIEVKTKWGMGYYITVEDKRKIRELMETENATNTVAAAAQSAARHAGSPLRSL